MAPVTVETGTEKQDESQNVSRTDGERGRDYYEFKEEIQYIRYNSRDLQSRLYWNVRNINYVIELLDFYFLNCCTIRAKTPEPCPASEDEMEIDDDTVRLDPCESQFKNIKLEFVNV